MAEKNKPNELYITRIYDAPVKMVWDAWTDTKQVAKWWGPRGFTITTHSKDLRPGGHWSYVMHGPDGTDWNNKTIYHEVEKYSKLVYDHGGNDDRPPLFRVTVIFTEVKGKTKMEMTMALSSAEAAKEISKHIKKAGGNATWDRLAEYLGETTSGKDLFFINRTFEADIKKVFEMWTKPEHFSKWLGPTGSTMEFIRPDIKVGSTAFYKMINADGSIMFGHLHYKEISPVHTLIYTQQFVDKDEKISRHPLAPTWPETMLTTVNFAEEENGKTRVTVKWEIYGEATQAERQMFHDAKGGITEGWTGSFDKLEAALL